MRHPHALASLLVVLSFGCGTSAAQEVSSPDAEPLAVIGERTISRARFEREMERRGAGLPGQYTEYGDRRALLEELVRHEALIVSAIEGGYDRDPDVLAALERIVVSRFRQDRLEPLLADIEVSDDEVREFYEANLAAYARPERIQVALVHFAVPPQASETNHVETEQRARAALDEARALGDSVRHFGSVARAHSDDRASRYKGGIIGWLSPGTRQEYRWDPAVLEAAFALDEPGQFAPVIRANDGFYLVRLVRREAARARPIEMLEDGLRHQLTRQKQEQVRRAFVDGLLSGIRIEINEPLLDAISAPEATADETAREPPPLPDR